MKRVILLLLALALTFSMTGCGRYTTPQATPAPTSEPTAPEAETSPDNETQNSVSEEVAKNDESGVQMLVVYFSRTGEQYNVGVIDKGNTAIVADAIVDATGADVFEILPADDHYPTTYKELTDVGMQEQREKARPAIAGELPNLSRYEVVFIGSPVWWGDWPMILYTFFESTDCSGVKLVPFSTHEGSGLSGFDRSLAAAYPDCEVLKGLAIRGADAQNDPESVKSKVNNWLAELGY